MRRALLLLRLVWLALAGCSALPDGDIGQSAAHDAVIKVYDDEEDFAQPRACDLYLEQRATDERGRTVEYDATIANRPVSIVYTIVAGDPFPLQAALYEGSTNTFTVEAGDHTVQVLGGDGSVLRTIDGYDGDAADTTVSGSASIGDDDGLALLGCALADRTALGDVPAFLRNLASGGAVPGQSGVGSSSENPTPILPDWQGKVSLLGAFWLMSGCLDDSGWHCSCWQSMDDHTVGAVPGWCP